MSTANGIVTEVEIPIGHKVMRARVPNLIGIVEPRFMPGVSDERAEIVRAILEPIGTLSLNDIARGRKNAAIVVNDITRPYPGTLMVEELARELNSAGIPDESISLVIAYGNHRHNTPEELISMYGETVVSRFRIVHHSSEDPVRLVTAGYTKGGVEVCLNKEFMEADLKILTGCIAPHQLAGFSGGRKSVIPGIAGFSAIKAVHSFPIRADGIVMGKLEGNRFHAEALEAAHIAGVDFIVNAVENTRRELVRCVAGDVEEAYLSGVETSRQVWTVPIPARPDIVIVSPGGYPRDFDLHQSQKSLGCAEMVCPPGGGIILCAQCLDGSGKPGKLLAEADSLKTVIDGFMANGFTSDGNGKAYTLARAASKYRVVLAGSTIPRQDLLSMFMDGYDTVEKAIEIMLSHYGAEARILVIPNASEIIPEVQKDAPEK